MDKMRDTFLAANERHSTIKKERQVMIWDAVKEIDDMIQNRIDSKIKSK